MKEKILLTVSFIEKLFFAGAFAACAAGLGVFLYINQELFNNFILASVVYGIILIIMAAAVIFVFLGKNQLSAKWKAVNCAVALIVVAVGIYIALTQLIFDYFQPFSTFAPPIICFGVFLLLYGLGTVLSLFLKKGSKGAAAVGICALCIFLVTALWACFQGYAQFNSEAQSQIIFSDNMGGYATYRIPSVLVIEKENGEDTLLVFAERRRDNSLDNGRIDIVYRTSFDGGKTFGSVNEAVTAEELFGKAGRVADPTPVYDSDNKTIGLLFRAGTKESGYKMEPYYVQGTLSDDGTVLWKDEIVNINEKSGMNFSPGPAKGTQLKDGTLAFPVRSEGSSYVVYTNDGGKTWSRGENSGTGGECDIASISEKEMVIISRNGSMSEFPRNNHLYFALSDDNGKTWYQKTTESELRTPSVMSSVASYKGNIYCAYADSYLTRANLSYAVSGDMGKTWKTRSLYSGASGYAVSDITSDGTYYIAAEIGKVEYHEEIRLFTIDLNK